MVYKRNMDAPEYTVVRWAVYKQFRSLHFASVDTLYKYVLDLGRLMLRNSFRAKIAV